MTYHSRSLAHFGQFLAQVSENMHSGAPLSDSLDRIRQELAAVAVALKAERRLNGHDDYIVVRDENGTTGEDACLDALLEGCRNISAVAADERTGTRLTLWVFRELAAEAFDADDAALCEILAPQLRQGLEFSQRLSASEVERSLYSSALDRLSVGVVMIDASGKVITCSAKAKEALSSRDGLQMQAGKLRAVEARDDRELQSAIRTAIVKATNGESDDMRGLALTKSSGHRNLGIIIQPVPGRRSGGVTTAATVAIYVRDPDENADVTNDLVRQLFDLTPAEAAVARRLAAGLSLEDAASSLEISRNTARAHLRSIFSKSGITRQTELVRMMLNSVAILGSSPTQQAA
jgi:DNA-binding CsgD family transcriptional regulator/PAS domain-containing protein